jgi:acetyl-CoA carboxylase biotin carboxyl carrier protein
LNFKEILELIDKVADKGIGGIEIEQAGTKIRIEGRVSSAMQSSQPSMAERGFDEGEMSLSSPARAALAEPPAETEEESESGLHIITSPIVGTFYRAANPESESFVNVGDRVSKGKVLCIVEAMKLMNEIESDFDGVVVRIYPQNGQPVEYGEKLFAVRA